MSVSQIQTLNNTLNYIILAQQLSNLCPANTCQNYSNSNILNNALDIAPYLNCLYGGTSSKNNSILQSLYLLSMKYMINFIEQLTSLFTDNTGTSSEQQTTQADTACSDGSCTTAGDTEKKSKGVISLTGKNLKSTLRKQDGTTFVVITSPDCGKCDSFKPVLKNSEKKLGTQATFMEVNYLKDSDLFEKLKNETNCKKANERLSFPIIIKCVDGKATELYDSNDLWNKYDNKSKMLDWFQKNI